MRRMTVTMNRAGEVKSRGVVVGRWRTLGQDEEFNGEWAGGYVLVTLDGGEQVCELPYRARGEVERALARRDIPGLEARRAAVAAFLAAVRAAAPADATVTEGEGYHDDAEGEVYGRERFGSPQTESWMQVQTADARVVVNVAWEADETGLSYSGHTNYRSAEGGWNTFTRRGVNDSFYSPWDKKAKLHAAAAVLTGQLARAAEGRAKSIENVGKWVTVPGAPRCVHEDEAKRIRETLAGDGIASVGPSGFGTGMQIAARPFGRGWTRNAAVARALGVPVAFTSTYDAD